MKTAIILLALVSFSCAFVVKKEEKPLLGGILCDICQNLVKGAENEGADAGEIWLKGQITILCKDLNAGSFLDGICESVLDGIVVDLDVYIKQDLPPLVCCQKVDCCS
uniref:Saposin B-type domain-containing protein n=1 Tax=Plectus sambesii TaxID=2011161 RepID=A0A914WMR1_9BILA